ncbi:Alpha/Beta hydrolase protein [Xylariales sp. PMI_506]|nr:Alpha/Beta hydrolase protein [Xylariales sp. PMI_506]
MQDARKIIEKNGAQWSTQVGIELANIYEPLQASNNAKYASKVSVSKALKYGSGDRHRIDVYYPVQHQPPESSPSSTTAAAAPAPPPAADHAPSLLPVVVYFHGGGFVAGDNDIAPSASIFGNIGYFFARNGAVACLATYRLVQSATEQPARWPSGPEDVAAALRWVQTEIPRYGGDPARVVAVGQSAGAAHLFNAAALGLLGGGHRIRGDSGGSGGSTVPHSSLLRPLCGAALLSPPLLLDPGVPGRRAAMQDYLQVHDDWEIQGRYSGTALFRQSCFGSGGGEEVGLLRELPCEMLFFLAEYDIHTEVIAGHLEFVRDYLLRFGKLPLLEVLKGHNHVSYALGLGLDGEGPDEAGPRLLRFVQECCSE